MKKFSAIILVLAAAIGVSACKPEFYKPGEVGHQGEAGVVLLSVNSTIPWDDAAKDFEPNFTMENGDAALNKVIRSTAVLKEQILDAFGVSMRIGLTQTKAPSVSTAPAQQATAEGEGEGGAESGEETGEAAQETSDESSEQEPVTAPEAPSTAPPSTALPPSLEGKMDDESINPLLEYKAAQSLFHAVKLLNAEVRNAAVRKGYVPHIVMLKLTPMLYRRNLAYDIHTKVSFWEGSGSPPHHPFEKKISDKCDTQKKKLPHVIPILATDNLERAINSRALEITRQIGLALDAQFEGIGAALDFEKLNRNLNAIEANDFNSLLTVGRLTDNSIYIRLGAANQATARYALIGKTYDIATLILVPQEYYDSAEEGTYLAVISHTEFRNTENGELFKNLPEKISIETIDQSFRSVLLSKPKMLDAWKRKCKDQKFEIAAKLIGGIQSNNWYEFCLAADKIDLGNKHLSQLDVGYLQSLWIRLAGATATGSFKSAHVYLRPAKPLKVPSQAVVLRDYGKNGMEVVLKNVTGARPGKVTVTLVYPGNEVSKDIEFPAETITIEPETQIMRLKFMSAKMLQLNPENAYLKIDTVECDCPNTCPENELHNNYVVGKYIEIKNVPPEPKFELTTEQKWIVVDKEKSTGSCTVKVKGLKEKQAALLTVEGGRLTGFAADCEANTESKKVEYTEHQAKLSGDACVDLTLDNLLVGTKVTVKATGTTTGQKKDAKTEKSPSIGFKKLEFDVVTNDMDNSSADTSSSHGGEERQSQTPKSAPAPK